MAKLQRVFVDCGLEEISKMLGGTIVSCSTDGSQIWEIKCDNENNVERLRCVILDCVKDYLTVDLE